MRKEQKHLEMIAKHEHNLAQQKAMLETVRTQVAEVRETRKPPINSVVRRSFCRLTLHVQFTLNMTLIRTWRMRLDLSSQRQTRKGAYEA